MLVTVSGIDPFTAWVLPDYKPQTQPAIKWHQLASGLWAGSDRGATSDIYDTTVTLYGKEAVVNAFDVTEVLENSDTITLSSFQDTEKIFGANIDYTGSITATILEIRKRRQIRWKSWSLTLRLRALSPSFTGSASFPTLNYCDVGYDGNSNWSWNKKDTYTGAYTYNIRKNDVGTFTGTFLLSAADMVLMRNYIRTQRTGNFTLSDTFGVDYPFGTRTANSYPYTVKLIDWEDLGLWGTKYWKIKLTFAENV